MSLCPDFIPVLRDRHSIIVAVTTSIIIARARPIIIASSPDVIGRPAPINVNGPISVIVARGGPVDSNAHNGSGKKGWRANCDSRASGIDTPCHHENIQSTKCCEQKHEKLRSEQREGSHDNK
jgi:hypothetical protein